MLLALTDRLSCSMLLALTGGLSLPGLLILILRHLLRLFMRLLRLYIQSCLLLGSSVLHSCRFHRGTALIRIVLMTELGGILSYSILGHSVLTGPHLLCLGLLFLRLFLSLGSPPLLSV